MLVEWFRKEGKRAFSFRGESDPFKVLCLALMLQKTKAELVDRVYRSFVERFPSPEALAKASLEEIKEVIKPIGMYNRRAKRFKEIAAVLLEKHGGKVPRSEEELLSLPGVGKYSASVVRCVAFGADNVLVDTNVVRIAKRLGIANSAEQAYAALERIVPKGMRKEFNLAMIDFGAKVCKAKNPSCDTCCLLQICKHKGANRSKRR